MGLGRKAIIELLDELNMPALEDIVYLDDDEDVGAEADMNNLDAFMPVSHIPTTRVHKDHPVEQIIRDLNLAPQTRRMTKNLEEHDLFSSDPSWIEAMQDKLLQFKSQKVWTLVDLPNGKRPIGSKWVFRNKNNERGTVIKNKARLVAQGYTQEEGIDYDEFFAPVARIESIRLFLSHASFKDFMVYQMDVKSDFLYGKIEKEVYVYQLPRFEDPDFPDRVYKVEKAFYRLHQAPRAWYETLSTYLLDNRFQRRKIDKTLFIRRDKCDILLGLQVKQKEDGIFISQDKYLTDILKKFSFTDVKTASTPMETQKLLLKEEDVCACARYQVNPKVSHLHVVKRIFRYLKGQPKLGLWYPKDSPFDLVAYTDSDYAGASLDRKSTTGGCQFLGSRLISWQCKKQTVVANSTTEAEYVVASSCYGQVLWIQNQLLDYGHNYYFCAKVNAARHNLLLLSKVNAARHNLLLLLKVNAARQNLLLLLKVNAARHNLQLLVNVNAVEVTSPSGWEEDNRGTEALLNVTFQLLDEKVRIACEMRTTLKKLDKNIGSAMPTDPQHTPTIIQPSTSQPLLKQRSRKPKRKDTKVPQPSGPTDNVADEAVNEEMDDNLEMVATTATSLDVE
ncbi:putative ribonuclease H-like domain-containing protein [Tanacetum coccineum]